MSLFGRGRGCRFGNIRGRIRAELCRIDIRCVIAGAVIVLLSGFLSALAGGSADAYGELELPAGAPPGVSRVAFLRGVSESRRFVPELTAAKRLTVGIIHKTVRPFCENRQ